MKFSGFNTSEKVGIGTDSPATTLDVNGTISSFTTSTQMEVWGATSGTQIHFRAATVGANRTQLQLKSVNQIGTVELYDGANNLKTKLVGNGISYFTGGSVGIGTTTTYSGTNVTALTINATSYPTLSFSIGGTHSHSIMGYSTSFNIDASGNRSILLRTNDTDRLTITGAGTATFSGALTATGNITGGAFGSINLTSSTQHVKWPHTSGQSGSRSWGWIGEQGAYGWFQLYRSDASDGTLDTEVMRFRNTGNAEFRNAVSIDGALTANSLTVSATTTLNADVNIAGDIGVANGRGVRGPSATERIIFHTTDGIKISTNSTERVRIKTDGKVGIGCTNPQNTFTVQVGTDHRIGFWGASTYSAIHSTNDANSAQKALRFDASEYWFMQGSVGIGTTAPSGLLDLYDPASGDNKLRFHSSTTGTGTSNGSRIGLNGTELFINNLESSTIKIYTQSTQTNGICIANDGKVGIGSTTPLDRLHVQGNILQLDGSPEYHFGTTSASHRNWRVACQEVVSQGFEIASGTASAGTSAPSDTYTNRFVIKGATGQIQFNSYGGGNHTGTSAYKLSVDSSGNIIETSIGAGAVDGAGTANYISKWTDGDTIGNSQIFDNGTNVGIGIASPSAALTINSADASWRGQLMIRDTDTASTAAPYITFWDGNESGSGSTGLIGRVGSVNGSRFDLWSYRAADPISFATAGAERMRIDNTGNVGIGETSPSSKLHVTADTANSNYLVYFYNSGSQSLDHGLNTQIGSSSATAYGLRVNTGGNSNSLAVMGDGNVGIGTGTPANIVDVRGSGTPTLAVRNTGTSTNATLHLGEVNQTAYGVELRYEGNLGNLFLDNRYNHSTRPHMYFRMRVAGTPIVAMTIDPAGNVGIGTTAPAAPLHVHKDSSTAVRLVRGATDGQVLQFYRGSTLSGNVVVRPTGMGFGGGSNEEKIFLHTDGKIGINETSPSYQLDVNGTFRSTGAAYFSGATYITGQSYLDGGLRIGGAGGSSYAFAGERLFTIPAFPNGVANQKVDLYWTGAFWGYMEIEITGSYSNQNMAGVLTKSFALGLNASNNVYTNESWYSNLGGLTYGNFAISDVTWDSTNSRYRIQIVHRVSTGNTIRLKMRCLGDSAAIVNTFMTGTTVGSIYTTDTTTFAAPVKELAAPNDNAWLNGGYLGIGTSTPSELLDIETGGGGGHVELNNPDSGGNSYVIGVTDTGAPGYGVAGSLFIRDGGSSRFVLTSSGCVGIGTTAPSYKLEVVAASSSDSLLVSDGSNGKWRFTGDGVGYWGNALDYGHFTWDTGRAIFGALSGKALAILAGGAEKVRILTDGKVGIGTNNPALLLHLNQAAGANIRFSNPTTSRYFTIGEGVGTNDKFSFRGNSYRSTDTLTVDFTNNRVGVNNISPSAGLEIKGAGGSTGLSFKTTDSSGNNCFYVMDGGRTGLHYYPFVINQDTTDSAFPSACLMYAHSAAPFTIKTDGNVGIGTTVPAGLLHTQKAANHNLTYLDTYSATNGHGSNINFRKSDNNTGGTKTQTDDGDSLGTLTYYGVHTGGDWGLAAAINVSQQGASGGTYVPSHIAFATCTASAYAEKMRIMPDGNVGIGTNAPTKMLEVEGTQAEIRVHDTYTNTNATLISIGSDLHNTNTKDSWIKFLGCNSTNDRSWAIGNRASGFFNFTYIGTRATLPSTGGGNVPMVLDGINNRVGIGNDAPNYMLDVAGDIRIGKGQQAGILHSGGDLQFYADGAKVIEMFTSGSNYTFKSFHDVVYFGESNVKVGIGTTSPDRLLHLYGGASGQATPTASSLLVLEDDGNNNYISFLNPNTANAGILWGDPQDSARAQLIYDHNTGYMKFNPGGAERVFFKYDGNVGIGTSAPSNQLHVYDGSINCYVKVDNGSDSAAGVRFKNPNAEWYVYNTASSAGNGNLRFWENSGSEINFTPAGNIGVGELSPGGLLHVKRQLNSAGDLWTVVGTGNVPNITIQNSSATDNTNAGLFFKNDSVYVGGVSMRFTNHSSDAAQLRFSTCTGGTTRERMILDESGHLLPAADGTYNLGSTSSQDWKELYIREIDMYNQRLRIYTSAEKVIFRDHTSIGQGITFQARGTQVMTIGDASGNKRVGIGTTAPSAVLDVRNGTVSQNAIYAQSDTSYGSPLYLNDVRSDTSMEHLAQFKRHTTMVGYLSSDRTNLRMNAPAGYMILDGANGTILRDSGTDKVIQNGSYFRPDGNNNLYLGASAQRWANVYSVAGNFSGNITGGSEITTTYAGVAVATFGVSNSYGVKIDTSSSSNPVTIKNAGNTIGTFASTGLSVTGTLTASAGLASHSAVGNAAHGSWDSAFHSLQIAHSMALFCETTNGADRNAIIGNNVYYNSGCKRMYTDETVSILFRSNYISFRADGSGTANTVFTPTEILKVSPASVSVATNLIPFGNGVRNLGGSGAYWKNCYFEDTAINGTLSTTGNCTLATNAGTSTFGGCVGIGKSPGYMLEVNGSFAATSKSFVIDHPLKSNHKLEYGALEGPEFGVYHRGRAQSDTITLPDYWSSLVRDGTITVQLTPNGSFQHLYVVSTSLTEIKIGAAEGETIDCYYVIYGERADLDPLVVEKIV